MSGSQTVNKRELAAHVLRCSIPKVDSLLMRYPDFPIEQRGDLGSEWKFDPERVKEFLRLKREEEEAAAAERADFLSQFELGLEPQSEEARSLSPAQRLSLVRAQREERKLALEAGLLVEVPKIRQALTIAITLHSRFLNSLPKVIGQRHNLPEDVVRSIGRSLDEERRRFYDELAKTLSDAATQALVP